MDLSIEYVSRSLLWKRASGKSSVAAIYELLQSSAINFGRFAPQRGLVNAIIRFRDSLPYIVSRVSKLRDGFHENIRPALSKIRTFSAS